MLVQNFLENSAARLPNKTALVYGKERYTYSEVNSEANGLAVVLQELGVQRQDRVAILLDNSPQTVFAIFGALKSDAVFVIINTTTKAAKLGHILRDCGIKILIAQNSKAQVVLEVLRGDHCLEHIIWVSQADRVPSPKVDRVEFHSYNDIISRRELAPLSQNIDLDIAAIIHTSGSNGQPKGVVLTHLNMISAATSITSYLENREEDIILNVLPLSFDYGLYQVLMTFLFGGTIVLEQSFTYPYRVIQQITDEKVSGLPGIPTLFAIIIGLKRLDKFDFSSLRYITSTGAPLLPAHIARLRQIFPHVRIFSMYGLTECKRVSYLDPDEIDRRPGSVGKPMPNTEVWLVDEQGREVEAGSPGELVVRGSNVMQGYWGRPDETSLALRPGKYGSERTLHTGDLFRRDSEGFLYFLGRKDDIIKCRGERVSPAEIENCLCLLDAVAEAAVIGVPDEILGQALVAFVRCHTNGALTQKDVLHHCRVNLETFMVPRSVVFVDSFLKTTSGKIDKRNLTTNYASYNSIRDERNAAR